MLDSLTNTNTDFPVFIYNDSFYDFYHCSILAAAVTSKIPSSYLEFFKAENQQNRYHPSKLLSDTSLTFTFWNSRFEIQFFFSNFFGLDKYQSSTGTMQSIYSSSKLPVLSQKLKSISGVFYHTSQSLIDTSSSWHVLSCQVPWYGL